MSRAGRVEVEVRSVLGKLLMLICLDVRRGRQVDREDERSRCQTSYEA